MNRDDTAPTLSFVARGQGELELDDAVPPAEYCPVSVGAKLLGDRWTLLIIRELMAGAHGFNQIHRGLPGLNRSVLSDRLRHLERHGLIRRTSSDGTRPDYNLTDAGHGLEPVIIAIGMWTIDWQFTPPHDDHADIPLLLWRMFQGLDRDALPDGQISIEFRFPDTDPSRGWIHVDAKSSGACVGAPDRDVDVVVCARPKVLYEAWYGFRSFQSAMEGGLIDVAGPRYAEQEFPKWFRRSYFAPTIEARQHP
jgi:DNA-binding HxlR family transcriptional regulator